MSDGSRRRQTERKLIGLAKERYLEWCRQRGPVGAPPSQWCKWIEWRRERIEYYNEEVLKRWP